MTTSPPISTADRDKAKELCAEATPGPWTVDRPTEYVGRTDIVTDDDYVATTSGMINENQDICNADFIAFARTAIPAYEARVVELEAALNAEKAAFAELEAIAMQTARDYDASDARATALLEALTFIESHSGERGIRAVARAALAAQQDRQTEG